MKAPKLFLATDHAGFEYKNTLRDYLLEYNNHGFEVIDLGAFKLDEADDYPYWIAKAARRVSQNSERDRAIIFGGSGTGEAIVANKFAWVRAVAYYGHDKEIVELSRSHNNANVLSFGARFIDEQAMLEMVGLWLATDFSGEERHQRRIGQIARLESKRFWQQLTNFIRSHNT